MNKDQAIDYIIEVAIQAQKASILELEAAEVLGLAIRTIRPDRLKAIHIPQVAKSVAPIETEKPKEDA